MTPYVRDFEAEITSAGKVKGQKENIRPEFVLENGVEMIILHVPGDKLSKLKVAVNDEYKKRFPEAYLAFSSGDVAAINGTPLAHLSTLPQTVANQMRALGIHTIEDLANLADTEVAQFMGGKGFRQKAKEYLANNTGPASELAALKAELAEIKKLMSGNAGPTQPIATTDEPKRSPGRPKKEVDHVAV